MLRQLVLAFALLVALLPAPARAQSASPPPLEPAACPPNIRLPAGVLATCQWLVVPERHARPDGPTIRLLVTRLRSRAASPAPDPLVYPSSGGPGGSAISSVNFLALAFDFLATRDVILLEQRGTRYSEPALQCPALNETQFANYSRLDPAVVEIGREVDAALACAAELRGRGVDLGAYTSVESAHDLEALRRALGVERWNMLGSSYTARLIMTVMRLYPTSLRAVVLDSVYDPAVSYLEERVPTFGRAMERLFAGCAVAPRCAAAYPDPAGDLRAVLAEADRSPIVVTVAHPRTGAPVTLRLTGDDLAVGLFNAMRDPRLLPLIPLVLDGLHSGDRSVIEPLAQEGFRALFFNPLGMYYAVECHEEYPFADAERRRTAAARYPELASFLPTRADPAVCAAWGGPRATPSFRAPLTSDVPALVFAGELDAVTAPEHTRAAAARLPTAQFVLLPGLPHAVLDHSPCARAIATAFVADPARPLDRRCLAEQHGPPAFVTPDALIRTPAIYRLSRGVVAPGDTLQRGLLGLLALAVVAQLGVVAAELARRRAALRLLLGGAVALATLALTAGLTLAMARTPPELLGFGLPAWAGPLRALPALAAALALAQIVALARARPRSPADLLSAVLSALIAGPTLAWALALGLLR